MQLAQDAGHLLASLGCPVIFGGGSRGLMGGLAEGVLAAKGRITGVIPRFMVQREWAHPELEDLVIVESMAERKERMFALSDVTLSLPGGLGTMDELLETLTLRTLGRIRHPVLLMNSRGFFDPLVAQFELAAREGLLRSGERELIEVIRTCDELSASLRRLSRP